MQTSSFKLRDGKQGTSHIEESGFPGHANEGLKIWLVILKVRN